MAKRKLILVDYLNGGHHATYITEFLPVLDQSKTEFRVLYLNLEQLDSRFKSKYLKYTSKWADDMYLFSAPSFLFDGEKNGFTLIFPKKEVICC